MKLSRATKANNCVPTRLIRPRRVSQFLRDIFAGLRKLNATVTLYLLTLRKGEAYFAQLYRAETYSNICFIFK